ncbi:MAG TPA: S-layer homology domain-containing protein [Syntrophomonadaceae bacterium]|nr:S-layer homology domain-containing protein [Syntrophomonadaceae bacterium]HPR94505.1 S-layer homology domain-containing protein [Syntrophomonadaceae bacterium]
MIRSRYKILSSLVIFMFLFTLFPAQADAQEEITVEKAINIVKSVFEVPDTYSKFSSGIRTEGESKLITLSWESADGQDGQFEARVNASNGDIVSMYRWSQADSSIAQLPVLTSEQAVKAARELLQKAVPDKAAHFRFIEDSQLVPLSGYGTNLSLSFMRYENNIPVENNTASVEINMADGRINSYDMNWSDIELPSAGAIISGEQAGEVFSSEKMLQLQYLLRQTSSGKAQLPVLVYKLDHPSSGMIDALSGEPVILSGEQYGYYNSSKEIAVGGMGSADEAALTPEEITEIAELADLMSQSEADTIIRKLAEIPAEAVLYSASLNQDYQDSTLRIWRVDYRINSATEPVEYSAALNAETGELLNYYSYNNYSRSGKADMTREAAREIAEAWLQKIQPDKISQTSLEADDTNTMPGYEPDEWDFNYQRQVNGVLCPGNGLNINVDRISGKVIYYNVDWSKTSFPGTGNVMGAEKAATVFLGHMPMTLTYITETDKDNTTKFRLVYLPRPVAPAQSAEMIDAVSGVRLDWEGKEIIDRTVVSYDDIDGNIASEQIELLAQSGIMTEYGSSFHPDEAVKLVTVLRAMVILNDGNYNLSMSDEEIIQLAVTRGWIDKSEAAANTVSRARMARLMVSFLRLDFVAKNGDMFVMPYNDAAGIPAELKGYAALAAGLKIICGDGLNFEPEHITTRGETAAILVRTLGVKPVQLYW